MPSRKNRQWRSRMPRGRERCRTLAPRVTGPYPTGTPAWPS